MKTILLTLSFVAATLARPGGESYIPPSAGSNIQPSSTYLPSANSGANLLSGFGGGLDGGYSGGGYSGGGGYGNDQKHVYFYAAPDEHEQATLRINVAPANQRNTRIIFVKAPSFGGIRPEIIAPPSQTEDKTLVYVLVKKPELGGSITVPTQLHSRPSKPEVYFIKYRNQQEAEQAVAGGLQEQAVGPSLENLGNSGSFIRTLESSQGGNGGIFGSGSNIAGAGIGGSGFGGAGLGGSGFGSGVVASRTGGGDGGYRYK